MNPRAALAVVAVVAFVAFVGGVGGCIAAEPPAPTWSADIAPLVGESCLPCHGADAAFDFSTVAAVVSQRDVMWAAMASGLMPPRGVDRSGACGDYRGVRPVDDDDIAAFAAWVEAGGPVDEATVPASTGEVRQPARVDVDGEVTLRDVLDELDGVDNGARPGWGIPRESDAAANDQHRCFLVNGVANADLVGFEVDAAAHLHHAMVFTVDDDGAAARRRDGADARPGWACDGPTGVDATLVATWTLGAGRVWVPAGTGFPLKAQLVLQLHSNGAAVGEDDDSVVRLFFSREPQEPMAYIPINATGFLLPPGLNNVSASQTNTLDSDLVVFGVLPHMHRAGRSLQLVDDDNCLAAVPHYDFGWQETAWLRSGLPLSAGTELDIRCVFDTSDRTSATRFGEGSADEMCSVFLLAASR